MGRISTVSRQFHAQNEISFIKNEAPDCPSFHSELTHFSRSLQSRSWRYAQTTNAKRLQLISACTWTPLYENQDFLAQSSSCLSPVRSVLHSGEHMIWRKELFQRPFQESNPGHLINLLTWDNTDASITVTEYIFNRSASVGYNGNMFCLFLI